MLSKTPSRGRLLLALAALSLVAAPLGASLRSGKLSLRKSAKAFCEKLTLVLMPTISASAAANFE